MAIRNTNTITVRVELFGTPRLLVGKRELALELPPEFSRRTFVSALADACPALAGRVIREDFGDLQEGYVLNRNGVAFLSEETISLSAGDSLLILSNQAGG